MSEERATDGGPAQLQTEVRPGGFTTLDTLAVDALALFVAADERPLRGVNSALDWRLCGRLSRVLREGVFGGRPGERALLPTGGRVRANKLFLFGAGPTDELAGRARELLGEAAAVLTRARVESVAIALPHEAALEHVDAHAKAPLGDKLRCVLWGQEP